MSGDVLEVLATGPQALVEDLGRPGHSDIGVSRSGAADREALRLANRALGNAEDAAAIEVLLGGLEVRVRTGSWLCVTGAPCPVVAAGRQVGAYAVFWVPGGARVRLGPPASGLRSYLAVRGGVAVAAVLGSRSHDVMSGLGPPPLRVGDRLPVGDVAGDLPSVDVLPPARLPRPAEGLVLRAVRGPRDAHLADPEGLVHITWRVSERSNRVGVRLDGEPLRPAPDAPRLPSEGAWAGAVQVPPGGEPVIFLADHPVTGGYPVVAVLVDADLGLAAQARPGQPVRFRWVSPIT